MTRGNALRRLPLALATGTFCLVAPACARLKPKDPATPTPVENPGVVEVAGRRFSDDVFRCKPAGGSALTAGAEATYLGGVVTLIESKCVSCHGAGGTPPELTSFELAADEGPASAHRVAAGTMPPGGLGAPDKALFAAWAKAEFPEGEAPGAAGGDGGDGAGGAGAGGAGAAGDAADADATAADQPVAVCDKGPAGTEAAAEDGDESGGAALVSYAVEVAPLLTSQCTSCHKPGGTPPDLTTYAAAKAAGERSVVRSVAKTMPPDAPMAPADIELMTAWKDAGYPETAH
jgi:hypothetical protein